MVSSPDLFTHLVEQTPANLAIQPEPSPAWTLLQRVPSSEADSSEDELNTFSSPSKKIKMSPKVQPPNYIFAS